MITVFNEAMAYSWFLSCPMEACFENGVTLPSLGNGMGSSLFELAGIARTSGGCPLLMSAVARWSGGASVGGIGRALESISVGCRSKS